MNPNLQDITAFKSMLALCQRNEETGQLRAVYYASCLVSGRDPLWGVWSVGSGKFIRYCRSKQDVLDTYAAYAVRRCMAKWQNPDDDPKHGNVSLRRAELRAEHGPLPKVTPKQARTATLRVLAGGKGHGN